LAVGGLVGCTGSGSSISRSYSSGNVSGQAGVGGLVGINSGTIQSSFAGGNVTDTCPIGSGCSAFGGLVGENFGNITKSFATGDVTVVGNHGNVGGLVGGHAVGVVSDSYATGTVTGGGGYGFGGLIGLVYSGGGVNNVFSLGAVSGGGSGVGALIGASDTSYGGGTIGLSNAYWNADVTGGLPGIGYNNGATLTNVTGQSTAQLLQAATFAGWNSSDTWAISNGATPTLLNMPSVYVPLSSTNVWTGIVNQLWSNAGNWSLGHVPISSEQVRIYDVAGTSFIDYTGTYSVKSIISDELFLLSAGGSYLTLQGSSTFNAGLNLVAGSTLLLNSGVLTVAVPSSGMTLNGAISAPTVKLNGVGMTGDVSQSVAGAITATDLYITGAGAASLLGLNNVQNLAASAASLNYNGVGDLSLVSHPAAIGGAVLVDGDALIRTTGNLTLNDSVQSTLGDITLVTGGDFIRSNGNLNATNGRWLVYSTSPLTDTLNGLTSDFVHYGQTYTGGAAYAGPGTSNGFLYSLAPTLTLTLNPVSRVYDGTTDMALNNSNFTVTGQINGDQVLVDNVLGSFDSATAGTRTLTAGSLTLAANNGATVVYGYDFNTTASNTAGSTISQRPVGAVLSGSVSKEYDATTVASLGANYSLSNVLAGDLASLGVTAATGNYADKNVGSGKTVTFSGLSLSGTAAGNYQLTPTILTSNSAIIDPKVLAVWTGTAGDGSWKNAANWQGGVAPEAANVLNASFPVGNGAVVFDMTVPTTLHSIDTFRNLTLTNSSTLTLGTMLADVSYVRPDATLTLQSGNHVLNGTLNAAGFELSGGQLAGNGVLNLSANSTLAGGALAVATTNNLAGAQMNVTGSTVFTGALNNSGAFNVAATGSLAVQAGAVLNAMAGSTWANAGTVSIQGAANAEAGASFNFAGGTWNFAEGSVFSGPGSFTQTGASLNLLGAGVGTTIAPETSLDLNALALAGAGNLNNLGTLSANNLTLGGSLINNGIFNVLGIVTVGGLYTDQVSGAMVIPAGSTFRMNNASGLFRWSGGALGNPNGTAGTLGFANGASFQFSGNGVRVIDGMNFNFTDLTLPNGSVTVRSGHLTLDGTSTIPTGVGLNVSGGTLTNNGQLNIAGSFALDSGAFDGSGGIDMQGGVMSKPASSSIVWTNTGNLNNTGTLDFGGGTITNAITNAGTINVGSGVVFQQLFTNNGGTLVVQPGTTTFSGGYNQSGGQTQLQGGSIVGDFNLSGGVLKGSGTINGNMTVSGGTLAVGYSPGSLNVTGNLNLNSASVLNIELGGTTPGSGYDVINVSGTANLAGTLNVLGWGGYTPAPGTSFNFLSFASQTGGFSSINLPAGWNISLNSGSGYLQLRMADLTNSSVVSGLQGLTSYQALLNSLMQTGASNIDLSALTINDTAIGFNRVTPNDYSSSLVQLLDGLTQVEPVTEFNDEKVCR
jgi:hypothetical protein